ncbi:MAG: transposase [Treponema sp.]|nr:transposase [Treponema sp.]
MQIKPENIGIDETSFRRRHEYVTGIVDKDGGTVIDILYGHDGETLDKWFKTQKSCNLSELQSISMDMWDVRLRSGG